MTGYLFGEENSLNSTLFPTQVPGEMGGMNRWSEIPHSVLGSGGEGALTKYRGIWIEHCLSWELEAICCRKKEQCETWAKEAEAGKAGRVLILNGSRCQTEVSIPYPRWIGEDFFFFNRQGENGVHRMEVKLEAGKAGKFETD